MVVAVAIAHQKDAELKSTGGGAQISAQSQAVGPPLNHEERPSRAAPPISPGGGPQSGPGLFSGGGDGVTIQMSYAKIVAWLFGCGRCRRCRERHAYHLLLLLPRSRKQLRLPRGCVAGADGRPFHCPRSRIPSQRRRGKQLKPASLRVSYCAERRARACASQRLSVEESLLLLLLFLKQ